MTNCPSCKMEMQALESLHLSHNNKTCPLAYRSWSPYELKIITDAMSAATHAARAQALHEAEIAIAPAGTVTTQDRRRIEAIRALAAQPATVDGAIGREMDGAG